MEPTNLKQDYSDAMLENDIETMYELIKLSTSNKYDVPLSVFFPGIESTNCFVKTVSAKLILKYYWSADGFLRERFGLELFDLNANLPFARLVDGKTYRQNYSGIRVLDEPIVAEYSKEVDGFKLYLAHEVEENL